MPRLPLSVVRQARRKDKLLLPLLSQCGDLDSAQNELRWLREHAAQDPLVPPTRRPRLENSWSTSTLPKHDDVKLSKLEAFIRRRQAGEPLQYIIGDQPFGELEILCEPKVLIPRLETETYTTNLVQALTQVWDIDKHREYVKQKGSLRILDICTGSGAIALLLHQLLRRHFQPTTPESTLEQDTHTSPIDLQIVGLDLSADAVRLARRNLEHNLQKDLLHGSAKEEVIFREIDATILGLTQGVCKQELSTLVEPARWSHGQQWDVIISNPPYVAPDDYAVGGRTTESVRNYEPRMALVPPQQPDSYLHPGDTFYPHILRIARQTAASLVVMEVGDSTQAERVRQLVQRAKLFKGGSSYVETWYDDGTVVAEPLDPTAEVVPADNSQRQTDISSSARAVVVWRDKWAHRRKLLENPTVPIRQIATKGPRESRV